MMNQHREEDALRGRAVKNQKAIWDETLEMRFLLQKAFSTSNKLPQEPIKARFCNHDKEVEQAYEDLLDSSEQTLGSMMELQEVLLESNQAAKDANGIATLQTILLLNSSASNGENDKWSEVQRLQTRIMMFRNTEIDKWQRKIQVTTGAAALKGKLHAFNQNISDQVAGYMRDPSKMISRMHLSESAVGVFGEECLESCDRGESESPFYALRKQQVKKRKLVDRHASKSIKISVHEKITNFMAPVPMVLPPMAPKLFENLFGMSN
ncbi:hypothetical protein PVAP13_3KG119100 [Panicum virgatum]|uniref:Uncharacterized protein n=1 Tax=Panicum virgatum TaxID=38727 RepID=A0A8T0UQB8_PANVG|nr:hypothetical protein PVAP13_3KG119100 [Panicum virgatum]